MSYQKTDYQYKDFLSVYLGKVHSPGAAGVSCINAIDTAYINKKRMNQKVDRNFRAIGL